MNKNKKTLLLVLVFVLLLGGAYILYNQLSGQVARDSIVVTQEAGSVSSAQETQAPEASPQAEEETPAETEAPAQEEAPAAPDFTVLDADGQEVRLSDMQGTPVVLNFWASWCPPCKSEMPDFEEASKTYEGKVAFMMVNLTDGGRETVDTAKAYIEEQGYTFPVYFDTQQEAAAGYGVVSIPTTYFIDAQGGVVAYGQGALDQSALEQGIGMILGE